MTSHNDDTPMATSRTRNVVSFPLSFLVLLFSVSAAQNMTTSLLTLLFAKELQPTQTAYFWMFMSWIYWFSPVSGWVSDICGSRKRLMLVGLVCVVVSWCLITWAAHDSFTMFIVFGALQNASMLFVNSAINGAIVEVAAACDDDDDDDVLVVEEETRSSSSSSAESLTQQRQEEQQEHEHEDVVGGGSGNDANMINSNHVVSVSSDTTPNNNRQQQQLRSRIEKKQAVAATLLTQSGKVQSKAMLARSLGSVVGAVIQTFLLVKIDIRTALGLSISLYGIATIVGVFCDFSTGGRKTREHHHHNGNNHHNNQVVDAAGELLSAGGGGGPDQESFCTRVQSLFNRLRQLCDAEHGKAKRSAAKDVAILLLFIFANNMLPDASTFYASYIFDAFEYPNWFNSAYQLGNLVGALVACEVYRRFFAPLSQTKVFIAGCAAAAVSYTTGIAFCTGFTRDTLHINNQAYLMVDTFCIGFLSRIAFLPILHVASSRCPKGFEAVVFELFSLAAMGGSTVSYIISIRIAEHLEITRTSWTNLWLLMLIAAASRILPLVVVPHLPPLDESLELDQQPQQRQQQAAADTAEGEEETFSTRLLAAQ